MPPASRGGTRTVMGKVKEVVAAIRQTIRSLIRQHIRMGRAPYICVLGCMLLLFAGVMLISTFDSREARAAPRGWPVFVAASSSNQWTSFCMLMSSGAIVLTINYLPKLEGEA
ncbi:unnamed protein product [Amoebophrya sp. A120]|nr:unnamed protein product [Amoebophrya sp. A120]|eukprot:GSA120T00004291001.1